MRRLALLLPLLVFFINPGFGCGAGDPEFAFGEAEMLAAVQGSWTVTVTPPGGTAAELAVTIDQGSAPQASRTAAPGRRGLVRAAHACGTRTFVRAAGACMDISEMPLDVTFVRDGAQAHGQGQFVVYGTRFSSGHLDLTLGDVHVTASVAADGTVASPTVIAPAGGAVSLVRSAL